MNPNEESPFYPNDLILIDDDPAIVVDCYNSNVGDKESWVLDVMRTLDDYEKGSPLSSRCGTYIHDNNDKWENFKTGKVVSITFDLEAEVNGNDCMVMVISTGLLDEH